MRFRGRTLLIFVLLSAHAAAQDEAVRLGVEAYIFGYPLVLMGLTEEVWQEQGSLNQFNHVRKFPDYSFRTVVRPNADTLYSSAWLDLAREPVILTVPDTKGRYYLVQLMDAWTNTIAAPGTRTTGNGAGRFVLTGPHWKGSLPPGAAQVRSPTNMVWMLGRIQTNTASDYDFVHALQDGFGLRAPGGAGSAPGPKVVPAANAADRPKRVPAAEMPKMDAATFFGRLCRLMKENPPAPDDAPLVRKLAKIGIVPGRDFDFARLDQATQQALGRAVSEGLEQLAKGPAPGGSKRVNGWEIRYRLGKYGTDYLLRAAVAKMGLGANLPEDAMYPQAVSDADGQKLDGARRYVLHFEKRELPPVNAFWSLTMYDTRGFFIENPVGRYAIGDRDKLKYNADGSLDLYIQHARPEAQKEANWLPAPAEPFNMSLRLYWPRAQVLDGTWAPPPIRPMDKR